MAAITHNHASDRGSLWREWDAISATAQAMTTVNRMLYIARYSSKALKSRLDNLRCVTTEYPPQLYPRVHN